MPFSIAKIDTMAGVNNQIQAGVSFAKRVLGAQAYLCTHLVYYPARGKESFLCFMIYPFTAFLFLVHQKRGAAILRSGTICTRMYGLWI